MSDLDIIKQIESELGVKFKQATMFLWNTKEYVLNDKNQVVSLGFNDCEPKDPLKLLGALMKLANLHELWLDGNQISDLGPLEKLTHLEQLRVNNNQINDIEAIGRLTSLKRLQVNGNRIKELKSLETLTNLQELRLNNNQISDLGTLERLNRLEELWLDGNQICNLEPLEKLTNLKRLRLNNNQISKLEPLEKLTNLQELRLDGNQINELEPLAGLNKLYQLSLRKNPLKTLPRWIADLSMEIQWAGNGSGVSLYDNPLESPPPEIVKQGKEAIRNYFKQLEEQDQDYLFEAKLLIVGEPGAGKTSMAKKLKDYDCELPKPEETTRGINVLKIDFPIHREDFPKLAENVNFNNRQFRMNIWDFGGQEIYKATHRFFLNKRSLYALVADNRMEDTDFNYWLHVVEMFGGDSPLLIVQNEKQERKRDLDISAMKARFANIRNDVHSVNFADKNKHHLLVLEKEIRKQIIDLPHIGSLVPAKWTVIRDVLEHDQRHTITLKDYLELCAEYGLEDKKDALVLAQYFHDIGVFLHFQDDPLLRKTIFLDSDWATNAVYEILDDPLLEEQRGRFSIADVESIWCEEEHEFLRHELLRLMNKFFLAYEVDDSGKYIVPDKLPGKQPKYVLEKNGNLHLTYDYDLFMPKGIMSQFIVEMHRFISDHNRVWKRGCLLEREGALAEIVESYDARNIQIRISGQNKRDFMTIIVDNLDRINGQYEKMKVDKLIPCNCDDCKESGEPYLYKFSDLKRRIEKGRREVECGKSYEMVLVQQLIDDVLNKQMPEKEKPKSAEKKKNKIFVSYSHRDKPSLKRLQTHLKVLSYEGVDVDLWDDTTIKSGEKWAEKIKEALDTAGVAVMLVSTDFLASDFIVNNELPPLLQAAENDGTTILPVIVGSCRFGKSKLSVFQSVNDPRKPLSKLPEADQDDVYIKLVDRIEALISG